jgi:hypothetical protein
MTALAARQPALPTPRGALLSVEQRRCRDCERQRLTRARRRTRRAGGTVVEVHVGPMVLRGLERLGLLSEGDRTPQAVAGALAYYAEATLCEIGVIIRRLVPTAEDEVTFGS